MTVSWELSIVELSKMDTSSGEMERGLEASSSPFWGDLSCRGESGPAPVLFNRCLFAESLMSRSLSCSIGRLITLGSVRVMPKAIVFGRVRSSLEGNRRGVPSGDLVFASTGASARRLLGDVVFIFSN